ncbi:ABC transporter ATP-binding protein [Desulfovibrio oxamicus]|uniref:ABC transporter ATP-binding protein n=1 Tax=Nitratidesulfovibrio oxamicus TaxID=32016 RepID=A0ABS0J598_9BACT|nr:ABC transporter ATP-binding protein [Nitratidesulfovibrio oxamicus]MBG3877620.1 ABC transporter ATP-binding protein [Nitratidesulfovibrio oxamicus]
MLEVRNIDVAYGDVQVIWDVSFRVGQGEIVAMIGANGAGKSTIMRTVSGVLRPGKGQILLADEAIHNVEPYTLIEKGLAHVPEARRLFPEMSVEENLDMGSLRGRARKERARTKERVFSIFPRLSERRRQASGTLSGGEQQMLAIGRGLMALPRLIMFDEPSLGLAPILVQDIFNVIRTVRDEGMTVLIVEQNVRQTLALCDRAYVLENGRITQEGAGADLLRDPHVKAAYLGV